MRISPRGTKLADDLGFTDDRRVETRSNGEQVRYRFFTPVDVQLVAHVVEMKPGVNGEGGKNIGICAVETLREAVNLGSIAGRQNDDLGDVLRGDQAIGELCAVDLGNGQPFERVERH